MLTRGCMLRRAAGTGGNPRYRLHARVCMHGFACSEGDAYIRAACSEGLHAWGCMLRRGHMQGAVCMGNNSLLSTDQQDLHSDF